MPAPWASGAAWNDAQYGGWPGNRGGGPGAGVPRALRLWLPVVISFLVQVPAVSFMVARTQDEPGGYFPVVLAMVGPLALIGARRFPGPVVAVTAIAAAALLLVRPDLGVPHLALIFAIILGIIRGARIWVYSSVGAAWVATIVAASVLNITVHPFRIVSTTFGLAVAMAVGEGLRARRERFRAYRRAADEQRLTVEQTERMRIARELHDVLAHSLSQINVQAGVGLHLIDSQPDKAAEALANIKGASKNALDEVRTVLGILRSDPAAYDSADGIGDDANRTRAAPLRPEPDLSNLPALVESYRSHGLEVTFVNTLPGEPNPPAATQLALYRICQEALTNVLRHANANSASVFLAVDRGEYLLTVTDDGSAVPPGRRIQAGSGLLGMRERAELLGGTLQITRPDNGGFRVEARIPRPLPAGTSDEAGGAPS